MGLGAAAEGPGARPNVGLGAGAAAFRGRSGDESCPAKVSAFAADDLEHKLRLVNRRQTQLNGLDILAREELLLRICLLGGNKRGSLLRRLWDSCDSCYRALEGSIFWTPDTKGRERVTLMQHDTFSARCGWQYQRQYYHKRAVIRVRACRRSGM